MFHIIGKVGILNKSKLFNIKNNKDLNFKNNQVFFFNNGYSSLGKFSHIEFISSPWVLNSITNKLMIKPIFINSNVVVKYKKLYNRKYKSYLHLSEYNYLYNTENNKLYTYSKKEMINLVNNLDFELRHWSQILVSNKNLHIINTFDNLKYLFNE